MLEIFQDDFSPPNENQQIVQVLNSRGNNLHEVQASDKSIFLASMPTKFRKNVWVKRGDYVIVEPIAEGDKVKAEMVRILTNEHVKYFKKENIWPETFTSKSEYGDSNVDIFVNTNKPPLSDSELSDGDSSHESTDVQSD